MVRNGHSKVIYKGTFISDRSLTKDRKGNIIFQLLSAPEIDKEIKTVPINFVVNTVLY